MRMLEKILAIAIVISLILKFGLIIGGDWLTFWSILILSIYYIFGFLFFNEIKLRHLFKKASYEGLTTAKIILTVMTGYGLSIICIGSLYKFFHLNGGNHILAIGLVVTCIVFIVILILFFKNRYTGINNKLILIRISIIGGVGIILMLTSELSIVKLQYRNHPEYIDAYTKYLSDPKNEELIKKRDLEYYRMTLTDEQFKMYEKSMNR